MLNWITYNQYSDEADAKRESFAKSVTLSTEFKLESFDHIVSCKIYKLK